MGRSLKDLKEQDVVRFLRFSITESAAATFTQAAYDTNLSIETGYIWMIHWIEWQLGPSEIDEPTAGNVESIEGQVTRDSKGAMIGLNDPDLIAFRRNQIKRSAAIGTDAGPLWWVTDNIPQIQVFPIALPFAGQTIYVGILSSSAAAKTIQGRIAFTIRKVSDKFFFRIAQTMIG